MRRSLRSPAAEAGVTVPECAHRLRGVGLKATVGAQRLEGHDLGKRRLQGTLPVGWRRGGCL